MTEGEEFDGKLARSKDLHVEIKDLEEKITDAREIAETLKAVKESREELGVEDEEIVEQEAVVEVNEPEYIERVANTHLYLTLGNHVLVTVPQERLNRHQEFEARDVGTGAFAG